MEETDTRSTEETSVHFLAGRLTGAEIIMAVTHAHCSVTLHAASANSPSTPAYTHSVVSRGVHVAAKPKSEPE